MKPPVTSNQLRKWILMIAEAIDAHRVVPRIILFAYGWLVWIMTQWYISIPSATSTTCQNDVLMTALDKGATLEQARLIACSIAETVGGPTGEQTMFVSIIVSLSSVVIGLYLNSGTKSKWQGDAIGQIQTINPAPTMRYPNSRQMPHNDSYGAFDAQEEEQPESPPTRGSWFSRRKKGKAQAQVEDQSQEMPEPPDLGEDKYQG